MLSPPSTRAIAAPGSPWISGKGGAGVGVAVGAATSGGEGCGSALPPTSAMNSRKKTKAARRARKGHSSRSREISGTVGVESALTCAMACGLYNRQVPPPETMPAVLLVTRDASTETLIQGGLGSLGYEVVAAHGSDAAVRSLFSVKVDAAIIDSSLGEDLDWLCQRLRGTEGGLPVVFLADAGARWLPGSLPTREGIDQLVVKPYSSRDVRQGVE